MLKISIEYCMVWHYTERTTSLVAELLRQFEPEIESISLIPSDGGVFEVTVNGQLVYSKKQTLRHAEPGEVARSIDQFLKKR